jgi:hypothetical protein
MPRFYFHLFNDVTAMDEEGSEFCDANAAIEAARADARYMAAQSVLEGHLILDHRIAVADEQGDTVTEVLFRDVVAVKQCAETA